MDCLFVPGTGQTHQRGETEFGKFSSSRSVGGVGDESVWETSEDGKTVRKQPGSDSRDAAAAAAPSGPYIQR